MTVRQPRYSGEEAARLGNQIYERQIRPGHEAQNRGKFIAIDIESGQWEVDADEIVACNRLLSRVPTAEIWMTRIGYGYTHRFGSGRDGRRA